jgi:hypothetical protein
MTILLLAVALAACGKDAVWTSCETADDCEVPGDATAECLPKGSDGFCTWACAVDGDCAFDAVDRVCASYSSSEGLYCLASCGEDTADPTCPEGFHCASSGGGDENRKACFPDE